MIDGVVIIQSESRYDFEKMVNEKVHLRNVKDIKFCVNADIHSSMGGGSYSSGETYYAMIMYGE